MSATLSPSLAVAPLGDRSIPLSVLDLATVPTGATQAEALRRTLALAEHVERLGYHRYWVAEHHGMPGIASSAPDVIAGRIAAATSTLRVGSGGVVLPNHAPLVVAERFATLEAFHPGRIDLGIGRAPGTDPITAQALRRTAAGIDPDDFIAQLAELRGYLADPPTDEPTPAVRAVPGGAALSPPIWLLGSSGYSAQLAGLLGLAFSSAHHFAPRATVPSMAAYRDRFRPGQLDAPHGMVTAAVFCADTEAEARRTASSIALSFALLRSGRPIALPSPDEVDAHPWTDEERATAERYLATAVVGTPEWVAEELVALASDTGADELMLTTPAHDPDAQRPSFTLAAEAMRALTGA